MAEAGQDQDQVQDLAQQLAALQVLFKSGMPNRVREMQDALNLSLASPEPRTDLATLHRLLHTLAGSAGTFGCTEVGERASTLVRQIKPLLSNNSLRSADLVEFAENVRLYLDWCNDIPAETDAPSVPHAPHDVGTTFQRVVIVNEDAASAEDVAQQMAYFGYDPVVVDHVAKLNPALADSEVAAVVMDMAFDQQGLMNISELKRINQDLGRRFPCIIIGKSEQYAARLAAVRAGADAYFTKPLNVLALCERLDGMISRHALDPYRILIVDDDTITSSYHRTVLQNAGMEVRVLQQPPDILKVLSEFQPELVLMDGYMPDCSGIELSKLIRQDIRNVDMPIVFLSGEQDFGMQLDAIQSGADDFLTKPISPAHLISAISSRSERYRALRGLIMRDGLTSLFNHSAIKEHLVREISRERRAGGVLSIAMIDLDFFKQVNDTYGHPVGDNVIKALSHLLLQRLRRSDIVGRYGGEEFVVVFPSTSVAVAKEVLDKIRHLFAKIRHHGGGVEFSCSFSAGIVEMGASQDADDLIHAADEALYRAKHNGRNCIEL